MNLLEAKAKFFDLQRAIDQEQTKLNTLIRLRVELVGQIDELEKEATQPKEIDNEEENGQEAQQ